MFLFFRPFQAQNVLILFLKALKFSMFSDEVNPLHLCTVNCKVTAVGFNNCFKWVRLTEHGSYYRTKALCVFGTLHVFSSIKMSKRKQATLGEFGFTKRVCHFFLLKKFQPQIVLMLFLFFELFQPQCSY